MKRLFVLALVLLVSTVFFGNFIVTMVTDTGGLGDQSFNDGTWSGIKAAEKELGMSLTSAYQLIPEQSTAAMVVHHPLAKPFDAGVSRMELLTGD